jgi:hypothetical protein
MISRYFCKNEGRKRALFLLKDAGKPLLNGIDYLEVDPNDQTTILVYFICNLPGSPGDIPPYKISSLKKNNILIKGGVRIKNIKVTADPISQNNLLKIKVAEAGDFSIYEFSIVTSLTESKPPVGFDSQLSTIEFSFKVNCPNDFDCKTDSRCPQEKLSEPGIDYLAKDYASFRRMMLERLSSVMPDWKERNPADFQVMLVELLAYTADQLSYYQDAVATEAYMGTARKRISLKRHARLLDYFVHEGCNSRTWISFEINAKKLALPAGTVLMTKGPDHNVLVASNEKEQIIAEQNPVMFETKYPTTLYKNKNLIHFYTWSDSGCCLPKGSTHATLINDPALSIEEQDILIFEEIISPVTLSMADADPSHRHAIRLTSVETTVDPLNMKCLLEIEWQEADKLPFPLCISLIKDGQLHEDISVARGNIVLADHGYTIKNQNLVPDIASEDAKYRPMLQHKEITASVQYDHEVEKYKAASESLIQNPHEALPAIGLIDRNDEWTIRKDLLGSNRFSNEFVAEIENDGTVKLRFGDDIMGRKPEAGFLPSAAYRIGNGRSGNVGSDTICRIISDERAIVGVRNPFPASGGIDPETLDEVREFAPQAFRKQERAVTEKDYAEKAQLHDQVQKATAKFRWTGSWYTVFLFIDRKNGKDVDDNFKIELSRHLEKYRMAGYDLEIKGPRFVPAEIAFNVCVKPGYFRSNVKEHLLRVFSSYTLTDGTRGFFHPDNFTFGQPVYLSALYQCALQSPGVASIEVIKFQRWAKSANHEIENGVMVVAELEIIKLDNDPNFPENGKIEFMMYGGL